MTGTGTQDNPFVPSNWNEFVTAIQTTDAYIECPENVVWDMNNVMPQGLSSTITINASRVKGNGLNIRNLRSNITVFNLPLQSNLYDISFENLYIENSFCNGSYYVRDGGFYGCMFTGINTGNNSLFTGRIENSYGVLIGRVNYGVSPYSNKGCGFNIQSKQAPLFKGTRTIDEYNYNSINIEDSHIIYNGKNIAYKSASGGQQYVVCLKNVLIEGKMDEVTNIVAKNSIFNCECSKIESNSFITSIVNTELCSIYPSSAIGVTSEEMKDSSYLYNLGFPIGVA